MESGKYKHGLSLLEMLIVVGVIMVLATMVIGIATHIDNQGKGHLTTSTISLVSAALEQFEDYGYRYQHANYFDLKFPLDCNGIADDDLIEALGETAVPAGNYTRGQLWCFFLSRVPESRETLGKIDDSLKRGANIVVGGTEYSFFVILDAWKNPLRYRYYYDYTAPASKWNFPLVASAGPDRTFGTADDITNK
jgi:type II secretory pathway pseudopilin PulG